MNLIQPMRRLYSLFTFCGILFAGSIFGQATLPDFTLKSSNGKASIFWQNRYKKTVKGISIQRSYDSVKNFSSIASILNPENPVNGFTDSLLQNNKVYYRLFIGFDTGYILTPSKRPEVSTAIDYTRLIQEINTLHEKNNQLQEEKLSLQKQLAEALSAKNKNKAPVRSEKDDKADKVDKVDKIDKIDKADKTVKKAEPAEVPENIISQANTYPSKRIYTDKDNNIITNLTNVKENNYIIRFLTEDYKLLFEIKNPPDDYFILEKVNFIRGGWYQFEIYKNDLLLEENKFYISSEEKKTK